MWEERAHCLCLFKPRTKKIKRVVVGNGPITHQTQKTQGMNTEVSEVTIQTEKTQTKNLKAQQATNTGQESITNQIEETEEDSNSKITNQIEEQKSSSSKVTNQIKEEEQDPNPSNTNYQIKEGRANRRTFKKEYKPVQIARVEATSEEKDGIQQIIEEVFSSEANPERVPPKQWDQPKNKVDGIIGGRPIPILVDTGAEGSLLPRSKIEHVVDVKALNPWPGPSFASKHGTYEILGELITTIKFGHTELMARWCVVDEEDIAILGQDFIKHHKLSHNWDNACWKGIDPVTGKSFEIEIRDAPQNLRNLHGIKLKKQQGISVECRIPTSDKASLRMVEPACTTSGTVRLMRAIYDITPHQETINVELANWGDETVKIKPGALIGHIWETEEPNSSDTNIHSIKSYPEYMEAKSKESIEMIKIGPQLNKAQTKEALTLLKKHENVFAVNPLKPNSYNGPKFKIQTEGSPTKEQPRRQSPWKQEEITKQLKVMLENGIIEEANSPWAAPVVLAKKKDGTWRFCVDYRRLNNQTKKDSYPLPRIDDTLDALGGESAKIFSTMDVASGYWHIPVEEADKEKTAFTCRNGVYQFKVLPFGLTGAPGAFCRAMDDTLRGLLFKICLVFVDDLVVFSPDFETHKKDLETVFHQLNKSGFSLKLSKCYFFQERIEYLGFVIETGRITVDPKKVKAIEDYAPPTNLKSLQRFLGMVQWYRRFIQGFANIAAPLFELLKTNEKNIPWEINVEGTPQNEAFTELKKSLMKYPILRLPDFKKEFVVIPDASGYGAGGVLAQEIDGFEHPIHFVSKKMDEKLRGSHSYEKETYALIVCLKAFEHYLYGSQFKVITDCRALSCWNTTKKISPKAERWLQYIQSFDIRFEHRAGEKIKTSDALSRDERHKTTEDQAEEETLIRIRQISTVVNTNTLGLGGNEIAKAQQNHRRTQEIIELLKGGKTPEDEKHKKLLLEKSQGYVLAGGILCKAPKKEEFGRLKPYIPPGPIRNRILQALHNDPLAGHQGHQRTLERIASRYEWESIRKDVYDHVRNCSSCNINKKLGRKRESALQPIEVTTPWQEMQMDFIGPLPETKKGKTYILTMVDLFTKEIEIVATKLANSETAKAKFKKRIITRKGVPNRVMTDNGSHFAGVFQEYLDELAINHDRALPYQHNTMGLVERTNRTVEEAIRHYVNKKKSNWDEALPDIQFALNTAVTKSHGSSAFLLNHGREPKLPIQNQLDRGDRNESITTPPAVEHIPELLERAKKRIQEYQAKVREEVTKNRNIDEFKVGETVMRVKHMSENKLDRRTYGPYRIVRRMKDRPANYVIENPYVGKDSEETQHTNDLLPFKGEIGERKLLESDQLDEEKLTPKQRIMVEKTKQKTGKPLRLERMIGQRIKVKWSQPTVKGWWSGKVIDYEPATQKFWVKYDQTDSDGTQHYEEALLGPNPPTWSFEDQEAAGDQLSLGRVAL